MNYVCMLLLCMLNTCIGVVTDGELHVREDCCRRHRRFLFRVLFGDFLTLGCFLFGFSLTINGRINYYVDLNKHCCCNFIQLLIQLNTSRSNKLFRTHFCFIILFLFLFHIASGKHREGESTLPLYNWVGYIY